MTAPRIKLLILLGLILLITCAALTAQMNARLGEVNQELSALGEHFQSSSDKRLALEQERDALAGNIAWAIAGMIFGAFLIAAGPLTEVARNWRAGQLSTQMKQATAALCIGILVALVCTMSAISISARIAQLDKDMSDIQVKISLGPPFTTDEDDLALLNLQAEKTELSARVPALTGGAILGIAVVIAGAYLAWSRRSEWMGAKQ
jgi:hypothetical protein